MKSITTIGLLFLGLLALGQDRVQKLDSLLQSLYAKEKINGNFLIAEKGKVIYSHSFGLANETTQEPLNENSIFELASCSKQFTAMAVMMLHEQGKLSLDDAISKYLPELSFYKNITVRHLLQHTGGLPDYMELMDSLFDKSTIAVNKDIVTLFSTHQPPVLFEPNTQWDYSNTGYALLASIIEKASGSTYADYLHKAIFQPLKMNNTFVYTRRLSPKKIDNYAFGYVYSDSLKRYFLPDDLEETNMVIWLDGIVGDGTVNSTVNDLLLWDRALYTNTLLSKKGMKAVFEVATLKDKSKTEYGMGWGVNEHADFGTIVSHSGGWPGYVTYIERHIKKDKTIIILQNHDNVSIPVKSIRNILYNKPLRVQKIRTEMAMAPDQLQKFVGTYEVEKGFEIKISLVNDQLYTQLTGQNAFPIFAESELLFFLKVVDAQIQFEMNETGEISRLFLLQNGNKVEAQRTR
jgi:CubicO group peptidase (beta-lactamase class C family)